ncbi:hypothetical protein KCU64_g7014, partial [Aureobasidium melanogenum]
MPPMQSWFKSTKPLRASRKAYYEDIFGVKNPEEDLEGVHIIDSDSDSDPGFFSRRSRRQGRKKFKITLRQSNKDRPDRGHKMDTTDGDEIVAPRVDRSTVVTIDDDDSDIGEQFVVDLRKHAQGPDNKNNEDDIEGPECNQKKIDVAFLAEVRKYAAQPPPINSESNDQLLEKINDRAQQFANQSPLGPLKSLGDAANALPSIEQPDDRRDRETSDEPTRRSSVGVPDDTLDIGAIDSVAVMGTGRTSTTDAIREHSWDPSQGSDYVYSDEEAVNGLEHAKPMHESPSNDNDQDEDLHDTDDEDKQSQIDKTQDDDTHDGGHLISDVQRGTSDSIADLVSTHEDSSVGSEEDDDRQQIIDLTTPTRLSSEEPPIRETRSFRPSTYELRDRVPSVSPARDEAPTRTKKNRFGLFASDPRPIIEPYLSELSDEPRPQRLRDLVRKRAREKEERDSATKKARYNLRPRRLQQSYSKSSLYGGTRAITDELAHEANSEAEERPPPRRITRSTLTKKESAKKPIPRFRAARKSAWLLVPKDDTSTSRREFSRPVVEVVVPKIVDRSTWGVTQSARSSPQSERRQSPALNGGPVAKDGEQKMEPALAGKGIKRVIPNENIDEEATVTKNGKQNLQFILID